MYIINSSTVPLFGSMILSMLTMIFLIVIYFYIDRKKILLNFVVIEVFWVMYSLCHILMMNTYDQSLILLYGRLLYTFLLILVPSIVYAIEKVVEYERKWSRILSVCVSVILIVMIWVNYDLVLLDELEYNFYYTPKKGPFIFALLFYSVLTGLMLIYRMLVYKMKSSKEAYRVVRPMAAGVVFFVLHSSFVGLSSVIYPLFKPTNYINAMFMTLMIALYFFNDIKYNITLRERMLKAYMYDELTEVYSRDYILNVIEEAMTSDYLNNCHVAIIDLDGFKHINDKFGHLKGDLVLKEFGRLLNEIDMDRVKSGRLGGDEFVMLFRNLNKQQIHALFDDLSKAYVSTLTELGVEKHSTSVGLSVGYIRLSHGRSLKEVLTLADNTMYEAKLSGKNNIVYYS